MKARPQLPVVGVHLSLKEVLLGCSRLLSKVPEPSLGDPLQVPQLAPFLSGPEVTRQGSKLNRLLKSHLFHLLCPLSHPVLLAGAPPVPSGRDSQPICLPVQLLFLLLFPSPFHFSLACASNTALAILYLHSLLFSL